MLDWPKYLLFVLTASLSIGATYAVSERIDGYQWYELMLAPTSIIGLGALWRWAGPALIEEPNDYHFLYFAVVFAYWFAAWAWFTDPFTREQYWNIVTFLAMPYTIIAVSLEIIWRFILRPRFIETRNPNRFGLVTALFAYFLGIATWFSIPIYLNTWLLVGAWVGNVVLTILAILGVITFLMTGFEIIKKRN